MTGMSVFLQVASGVHTVTRALNPAKKSRRQCAKPWANSSTEVAYGFWLTFRISDTIAAIAA